jgi:hypothetical protein
VLGPHARLDAALRILSHLVPFVAERSARLRSTTGARVNRGLYVHHESDEVIHVLSGELMIRLDNN